jgi:hypothetical protein
MQAVSVEGDGLAVSRQARRMHVAADDRLHPQPVAASIHRPYQPRERDGSMPLSTHGRNDRSMAAGMRDARPWQGQVAGRMNRAGRAVPADDVGLARPDGDQAVSRCIGSEVGAGIPQCIRRHRDSAQGARIQTPGRADAGQLAGAGRVRWLKTSASATSETRAASHAASLETRATGAWNGGGWSAWRCARANTGTMTMAAAATRQTAHAAIAVALLIPRCAARVMVKNLDNTAERLRQPLH